LGPRRIGVDSVRAMTEKVSLLKLAADEFELLLRKYACIDSDAEIALRRVSSLLQQIQVGVVVPPHDVEYGHYEFSTEGSLFRYPDLCASEARFAAALGDWYSQPWFKYIADE